MCARARASSVLMQARYDAARACSRECHAARTECVVEREELLRVRKEKDEAERFFHAAFIYCLRLMSLISSSIFHHYVIIIYVRRLMPYDVVTPRCRHSSTCHAAVIILRFSIRRYAFTLPPTCIIAAIYIFNHR